MNSSKLFRFPPGVAEIILGYSLEWTMIPAIGNKILNLHTMLPNLGIFIASEPPGLRELLKQ